MDLILPGSAPQVLLLAAVLLAADVLLGIAIAIQSKTFDVGRIGDFLKTSVLPYGLGIIVFALLLAALPLAGVYETLGVTAAVGAWAVKIAKDVLLKFLALFS